MIRYEEIEELIKIANGNILPKKQYISIKGAILNKEELLSNKIFPLFKWNDNPNFVINGIRLKDRIHPEIEIDDIEICWQELTDVEIHIDNESKDFVASKGGRFSLSSIAYFNLYNNSEIEKERYEGKIHPIYHITPCDWVRIEKDTLIIDSNTNDERNVEISIAYRYGKVTKTNTLKITQLAYSISQWEIEYVTTEDIELCADNTMLDEASMDITHYNGSYTITNKLAEGVPVYHISKGGGLVNLTVWRNYINHYIKKDSNGDIVGRKASQNFTETINENCTFSCSETNGIKLLGSHAIIEEQELKSPSRDFHITAHFQEFESSIIIRQEEGGTPVVIDDLYFLANHSDTLTYECSNSLSGEGVIPFVCNIKEFLDNKPIANYEFSVNSMRFVIEKNGINEYIDRFENDWLFAEFRYNDALDGSKFIYYKVKSNPSKVNNRWCDINIVGQNPFNVITIHFMQPYLKCISMEETLEISGKTEYNICSSTEYEHIDFIPRWEYTFEDGTKVIEETEDTNIKYSIISESDVSEFLHIVGLVDNHEKKCSSLYFYFDESYLPFLKRDKFEFMVKAMIPLTGGCISASLCAVFTPTFIDEEYTFNVNANEYLWKSNWTDSITIPIESSYSKKIQSYASNNVVTKEETRLIPYAVVGEAKSHYNVELQDNILIITPTEINSTSQDIIETVVLTQEETNKTIKLTLIHEHEDNKDVIVNIKVIVRKKEIKDEIWSSISTLYVRDINNKTIYSLEMSPTWLYPNIFCNQDVIYNGYIIVKANTEYRFISKYFKIKHNSELEKNNYNFAKKYSFKEDENELVFYVDL